MVPPTSSNRQLPPHRVPLEARGGGGFPNDTPDPDPNQQKDEEEEPHAQLPRGEELLFGVVGRWGRFFDPFSSNSGLAHGRGVSLFSIL